MRKHRISIATSMLFNLLLRKRKFQGHASLFCTHNRELYEFDSTVIQPTGVLYPPNCWYWLICTRKFSSIPTCHWKWSHREFALCMNHKSSSTWWERVTFLRVFQSSSNYSDSHWNICILHTKFENHLFSINLFVVTTYLSRDYLRIQEWIQNFTRLPPLSNTNLNKWLCIFYDPIAF